MMLIDWILNLMYGSELAGDRIEIWSRLEDERQYWVGF